MARKVQARALLEKGEAHLRMQQALQKLMLFLSLRARGRHREEEARHDLELVWRPPECRHAAFDIGIEGLRIRKRRGGGEDHLRCFSSERPAII